MFANETMRLKKVKIRYNRFFKFEINYRYNITLYITILRYISFNQWRKYIVLYDLKSLRWLIFLPMTSFYILLNMISLASVITRIEGLCYLVIIS